MNSANATSESESARTSNLHPGRRHEGDYLSEQRAAAQGAIRQAVRQFGRISLRMKSAVEQHPYVLAGLAAGITGALALWLHLRSVKSRDPPEQLPEMKDGLWHRILKLPVEIIVSALLRRLAAPFQESFSVDATASAPGN